MPILSKACDLTGFERELAAEVNRVRAQAGLGPVPVSRALQHTARTHVWDLNTNNPAVGNCNPHSWSNNGPWKGMCYTPDHAQSQRMYGLSTSLLTYGRLSCLGGRSLRSWLATLDRASKTR
jgi:hypothetical protein